MGTVAPDDKTSPAMCIVPRMDNNVKKMFLTLLNGMLHIRNRALGGNGNNGWATRLGDSILPPTRYNCQLV